MVELRSLVPLATTLLLMSTGTWANGTLPPVGSRIYVIDDVNLFSPSAIYRDNVRVTEPFLRDPRQPDDTTVRKALQKPPPRAPQKIEEPEMVPAQLSFRPIAVTGKVAEPRVVFDDRRLDLERADEDLSLDFLSRIFADDARRRRDF